MYSLRLFVGTVLIGGLTLAAFPGYSVAETPADSTKSSTSSSRLNWSRRVLQRSHPSGSQIVAAEGTFQAALGDSDDSWTSDEGVLAVNHVAPAVMQDSAPMIEVGPGQIEMIESGPGQIEMMPLGGEHLGQHHCSSCGSPESSRNSSGLSCDSCNTGCSQSICHQLWSQCASQISRKVTFFSGVHGFKGPVDQGANGNFGFHEGLNIGMPVGDPWGVGFQAGIQAVHSNFSGDQVVGVRRNDRDQVFFTGGLFRRPACGGLQWGVVFDFLHDSYYDSADMAQIRAEIALVKSGSREIGFWGAFGINDDDLTFNQNTSPVEPVNVYAAFYRRHFSGGGQGRVWIGLTSESDTLFGTEITVPLGTCWALENNFTYLLPKEGRGTGAQQDESWSVMMQLVWYPGRSAACVATSPYNPLLGVADNTWFLVRRP